MGCCAIRKAIYSIWMLSTISDLLVTLKHCCRWLDLHFKLIKRKVDNIKNIYNEQRQRYGQNWKYMLESLVLAQIKSYIEPSFELGLIVPLSWDLGIYKAKSIKCYWVVKFLPNQNHLYFVSAQILECQKDALDKLTWDAYLWQDIFGHFKISFPFRSFGAPCLRQVYLRHWHLLRTWIWSSICPVLVPGYHKNRKQNSKW